MTTQQSYDSEESFESCRSRGHREEWLLHDLDDREMRRGLEIGALDNPTHLPAGVVVEYVDYASTQFLQEYPHEDTTDRSKIVHVDHIWPGSGSLADVCGRADYDFVIASHVIEHVPNVLGWFAGIYDVLRPGGVFNLAIPDRRYTFDIRRKESTLGEMMEAYLYAFKRPSVRQMFDHTFGASAVEPGAPWQEEFDISKVPRYSGDGALELAFAQAERIVAENAYFDSHCWVFTPSSFLECLEGAIGLGVFPFVFSDFVPTEPGSFEFYVSFRKEFRSDEEELRSWQLATVRHLIQRVLA